MPRLDMERVNFISVFLFPHQVYIKVNALTIWRTKRNAYYFWYL